MKKNIYSIGFWVLVLIASVAVAETVYKGKDAAGNTIYSDQPVSNGKAIEITVPPPVYTPPVTQTINTGDTSVPAPVKYTVLISEPQNDQTYNTDQENIQVKLSIEPALKEDYKIRLFLNASPFPTLYDSPTITLDRLSRGAYQLQAQIVSKNDIEHPVAQSDVVMFFQKRTTINKSVKNP
jgi:hypothetical protein